MPEGLRNLNKVILVGRLTHSPDLKYTPKGNAVTRLNIAVNTKRRGKQEDTLFIDIIAWNKLAEFSAQYFKKGKGIYVEGSLSMRKWKPDDSELRTKIEVVADKISFLDSFGGADDETQNSSNDRQLPDSDAGGSSFSAADSGLLNENDIPF